MENTNLKERGHKEIQKVFSDYAQITIPLEEIKNMMAEEEKDAIMGKFWLEEYECESLSDTMPRENLFEIFAQHFLGRGWPTYMEDGAGFFRDLGAFIAEKGWYNKE